MEHDCTARLQIFLHSAQPTRTAPTTWATLPYGKPCAETQATRRKHNRLPSKALGARNKSCTGAIHCASGELSSDCRNLCAPQEMMGGDRHQPLRQQLTAWKRVSGVDPPPQTFRARRVTSDSRAEPLHAIRYRVSRESAVCWRTTGNLSQPASHRSGGLIGCGHDEGRRIVVAFALRVCTSASTSARVRPRTPAANAEIPPTACGGR